MYWDRIKTKIYGIKRIYWQFASLIFANSFFLAGYLKFVPFPILNCYACPLAVFACPIGTLQNMLMYGLPIYTISVLILAGIIGGRVFCGYMCPFGLLQDLLAKIKLPKITIPKWTEYTKYLVLVLLVIVFPIIYHTPTFCKVCPAGTLEAGIPIVIKEHISPTVQNTFLGTQSESFILQMIGTLYYIKIGILAFFLISFMFINRFFCRVFCPLGAILSIFNKITIFFNLKLKKDKCKFCNICKMDCPVDLIPPEDINSPACIKCGECTDTRINCKAIVWKRHKNT